MADVHCVAISIWSSASVAGLNLPTLPEPARAVAPAPRGAAPLSKPSSDAPIPSHQASGLPMEDRMATVSTRYGLQEMGCPKRERPGEDIPAGSLPCLV